MVSKDEIGFAIGIMLMFVVTGFIVINAETLGQNENFMRLTSGIAFQVLGFVFMLIASSGKIKLHHYSKNPSDEPPEIQVIKHHRLWGLGIMYIIVGLLLQLWGLGWEEKTGIQLI